MLIVAAIAGNTTNYHIGRWIGPPAFSGKYRFLKVEYLQRTESFFDKYGSMTIVLSRFVPIIRTCAPFVAGVGAHAVRALPGLQHRRRPRLGAVCSIWAGYFFGNIPFIKNNFGLVTIGIIVVSMTPDGVDGAEKVSGAYRSFAHRVDIGAPVERVWRAFTDSRVLTRWCADDATITPREKGRLHVMFGGDVELDAHIDVLVTAAAHAPDPAADPRHADLATR